MRLFLLAATAAAAIAAGLPASAAATFYGPSPYLSTADSPFHAGDYANFYFEDFEDGLANTPGVSFVGPSLCITHSNCAIGSIYVDSVGNGGDGTVGHSMYTAGRLEITFDAAALGGLLPTAAGFAWTDGNNPITFQAYDQDGGLLGQLFGSHADNLISGETAEDRFYGVVNAGGISKLVIFNPPGLEIDHLQYGVGGVPEPAAWGLMLTGFFGAGAAIRRRRRAFAPA